MVEFQPSQWSLGTYLNVGAMWLWCRDDNDVLSFDHGHRLYWKRDGTYYAKPPMGMIGLTDYLEYRNDEQFGRDVRMVVEVAAKRTEELRRQFQDLPAVARCMAESDYDDDDPRTRYRAFEAGVAAGLGGDADLARRLFARAGVDGDDRDWAVELTNRATKMAELVGDADAFRARILGTMAAARQRRKLPEVDLVELVDAATPA